MMMFNRIINSIINFFKLTDTTPVVETQPVVSKKARNLKTTSKLNKPKKRAKKS